MKCKQINGKEKIPMILPNNQNRKHQTTEGQQAIIIEYPLVENWNAMTQIPKIIYNFWLLGQQKIAKEN